MNVGLDEHKKTDEQMHFSCSVSVFLDILIDDPASLDSQLCDTFSNAIYRKGAPRWPFIFGVELIP
jgi:hypothetical protein